MLKRIIHWLGLDHTTSRDRASAKPAAPSSSRPPRPASERRPARPEGVGQGAPAPSTASDSPLIRNKYIREDTGTHETLKILDDSIIDSGEEAGFDPYNTGDFDRSRNWERRNRD